MSARDPSVYHHYELLLVLGSTSGSVLLRAALSELSPHMVQGFVNGRAHICQALATCQPWAEHFLTESHIPFSSDPERALFL